MNFSVILYCDSSALVKLVFEEPESTELEAWLGSQTEPVLISNVLAHTEVVRAVARTDPDAVHLATDLLAAVSVVELDVSPR
ncbi:MAG: PIN domain-containing protein [Actinomycetota bacterium]|nr:PIN domain-containing protein [Actinomycetota bacterium]